MIQFNYALLTRAREFATIIDSTVCTNANNEVLALEDGLKQLLELFENKKNNGNHLYVIGNGGSAAVASHAVTDFVNVSQLRAFTLHESTLMTCMANDFGYEEAYKRIVNTIVKKNDLLIAISSSGKSKNICDAVKIAKEVGADVLTLSGFVENNPLRQMGDFNLWLNSNDYGLVEIGHLFILHNLADRDRDAIAFKDQEKLKCAGVKIS